MIVVTGAAGFIGSNLVRALNRRGLDNIMVVDTFAGPTSHLNLNRTEYADMCEPEEFLEFLHEFEDIEMVFHLGATTDTLEKDGVLVMRNNYLFSRDLLNWCREKQIRCIYASSAAVYGMGTRGFTEERANEYPLNIYGYSKFLLDQWLRRNYLTFQSQVVGMRFFNVYGPQEAHKGRMASPMQQFYQQAKEGKPIQLFEGSDKFLRDFIHVDDAVRVALHFYDHPDISGIFNVGTGEPRSFADVAELVAKSIPGASIESVPFPEDLKDKYQPFTKAEIENLRETGYNSGFIKLEEGIRRYMAILQEHGGFLP